MNKQNNDLREQHQRDQEKVQHDTNRNRQQAEQNEVAGRHKNDGMKDHQGNDKGPRGQ